MKVKIICIFTADVPSGKTLDSYAVADAIEETFKQAVREWRVDVNSVENDCLDIHSQLIETEEL